MKLLEDTKTMRARWIGLLEEQLKKLAEINKSKDLPDIIAQANNYIKMEKNAKHIIPYDSPEASTLFGEFLSIMNGLPFDPNYKTRESPDYS